MERARSVTLALRQPGGHAHLMWLDGSAVNATRLPFRARAWPRGDARKLSVTSDRKWPIPIDGRQGFHALLDARSAVAQLKCEPMAQMDVRFPPVRPASRSAGRAARRPPTSA